MVVKVQTNNGGDQAVWTETEPHLVAKRKPKKNGSVFPAKRRLVKTMAFNSILHFFVSLCSSAGGGAANPNTPNGKKVKQIVPDPKP